MSITEAILSRFGKGALKRSALRIGDGEGVFRKVLGGGRYRTALEIGTYRGASAACMAQFCDVITIDLRVGQLEKQGEVWDRRAFWEALGITNIDLRLVSDDQEKSELVRALDFDFAFIDGAHDKTVGDDFQLVRRCGAVLFHDCKRSGVMDKDYVAALIDTLPRKQVRTMGDSFALWQDR